MLLAALVPPFMLAAPAHAQSSDDSFDPGVIGAVYTVAVQADSKIVIGGFFSRIAGQPRDNIGRVNADGSLDTAFNPGADGEVDTLAVQADGKIVVGGYFGALGGQPRSNIGRLNANGSLDTTFDPGADGPVFTLAVQANAARSWWVEPSTRWPGSHATTSGG